MMNTMTAIYVLTIRFWSIRQQTVMDTGNTRVVERIVKAAHTCRNVQKAGISVLDENGKCSGMILITGDVSEISSIMSNLDTGNVFERIGLTDGTSMLAVLELATAENEGSDDAAGGYLDMITYNAQVKNGRYIRMALILKLLKEAENEH